MFNMQILSDLTHESETEKSELVLMIIHLLYAGIKSVDNIYEMSRM